MPLIRACLVTAIVMAVTLGLPLPLSLTPALTPSAYAQTSATPADIQWTYQAETGPKYWADLAPDFATCASGKSQSPINLTATESADLVDPDFHYEPAPLNILNNGHTVQVPYAPGSYFTLDGQQYNLLQFHFHSPSEHTVEGQPLDAELHLVHQSGAGALAVVSVLLQADDTEDRASYSALSANLPNQAGDKVRTGERVNAKDLLPTTTTTYRYSGSLTTPPCSESVTWLVMTEPVTLSTQQISRYQQLLNHNNRPLQLLNNRDITIDTSP